MIIRIVKLSFHAEYISDFKTIFEKNKQKIISQKGCNRLEMLQDINDANVIFTYSWWHSEDDLNNYRNSELFIDVWSKTKILFNKKPEAWSTKKINEVL
tara:strand:- start:4910 stop:5206 length:297 start_codon:yes stop_codon:yes gene_type:complete